LLIGFFYCQDKTGKTVRQNQGVLLPMILCLPKRGKTMEELERFFDPQRPWVQTPDLKVISVIL